MKERENELSSTAGEPNAGPGTLAAGCDRRKFLGGLGGVAAAAATALVAPGAGGRALAQPAGGGLDGAGIDAAGSAGLSEGSDAAWAGSGAARRARAFQTRASATRAWFEGPHPGQVGNGDEGRYPSFIGNYSKALPHNGLGEVDPAAYATLLKAVGSGRPQDFEQIALGGHAKLTNPQSGIAFDLEGADAHALAVPPAPALASAEEAGEAVELYWMALLRDVNFTDYATHPDAAAAAADLNRLSDFRGPREGGEGGRVTPQTLFRDVLTGATTGPYMSQFWYLPTPFGAEFVDRRARVLLPGTDQLTGYDDWLNVQNGGAPGGIAQFDSERRYLRNGRDLSAWVHIDVLFQAYFNACLILITPANSQDPASGGIGCPLNPGNPYLKSRTQVGFGTFGPPGIKGLMCEVATRALRATWHKKWFVHRRLRPEAFGGLAHLQQIHGRYPGVLHSDVLGSPVLQRTYGQFGSFLHPQAFPEGCPTHPSYTAGHASVAGACVTILKALFDERFVIPEPMLPSEDGLSTVPYTGPALTVGGELNKLASNVGTGRNIAGVHWRSDALQSFLIGEQVAIDLMTDQRICFGETRENFFQGFTFTRFDGTTVTV
jgi:hypothetical protein